MEKIKIKELDDVAMQCIAMTSPAINFQYYTNDPKRQQFNYPHYWDGKVPLKVKLKEDVKSDLPSQIKPPDTTALKGNEYYAWVNSHGAVSAILPNGEKLGLYPREFTVTEFHPLLQHNLPTSAR